MKVDIVSYFKFPNYYKAGGWDDYGENTFNAEFLNEVVNEQMNFNLLEWYNKAKYVIDKYEEQQKCDHHFEYIRINPEWNWRTATCKYCNTNKADLISESKLKDYRWIIKLYENDNKK